MNRIIALFAASVLVSTAVGAESLSLTVDKSVELSLQNNLTLKNEDLQLQSKKRSRDYSWNAFIPKTSVGAALSRLNQAPTNPFSVLKGTLPDAATGPIPNNWIASASFSTQLTVSLALFDGIRHTAYDYEAGQLAYQDARQKVIRDTKKAFYNLLLLQANLATISDQVDTAGKHYQKEKRNFEAGMGSEYSMLNAQVAWENAKPGLDEMKIAVTVAQLSFKQMLGLDPSTDITLEGGFDHQAVELDSKALVDAAINNNLSVASLRQAIKIQKNLRRGQFDLDYLPVLGLSWTADPTFQKDPFSQSLFSDVPNDWKQSSGIFSVFVSLPLDGFLPFSSTAVSLANFDDGIAQQQNALLQAIQGETIQVTSLVLQVEKSRQTIDRLSLNVDLANRAYQMAERGYESGAYELLQVEDADSKLREAKLNVLAEKYAFLSGLFDLEYETNLSLTVKS